MFLRRRLILAGVKQAQKRPIQEGDLTLGGTASRLSDFSGVWISVNFVLSLSELGKFSGSSENT